MSATRFERAIQAFDRANSLDPQRELVDGIERPRELVQAERLGKWIERVAPQASEALRLAARCQHLRRWEIPRDSYPAGRSGYLKWRARLAEFHAQVSGEILEQLGFDDATIERVRRINLKQGLSRDAEVQAMEDALCLSFLEHELETFAEKHDDPTLSRILRKTWAKMSPQGRELVGELTLPERVRRLLEKALAT